MKQRLTGIAMLAIAALAAATGVRAQPHSAAGERVGHVREMRPLLRA